MSEFGRFGLAAVLFSALPLVFAWLTAYTYVFFQPLDRMIDEERVRHFLLAGLAFGIVAATVLYWWLMR